MATRLFILGLLAFALPDVSFAQGQVLPILNCVEYDLQRNEVVAYFGYASSHTTPVTIPVDERKLFLAGGTGPQGERGLRGEQGAQGERGPQGEQGPRGEQGP
jgi:hypothetical protein